MKSLTLNWLHFLALLLVATDQSQASPGWFPPPSECQSSHNPAPVTGPSPPLPQLPRQYSMRVEANIIPKGWTTEVEEHYDGINDRASVSLSFNGTTTISIFNFNTSERYDIYPNGTCNTRPSAIDYLGLSTMGKQNRTAMATVNEVFRFGTKYPYYYVGREWVRGIPVHHWTSCQEWQILSAKFQLDYYFSVADYTTAAGHEQIPIRAVLNGSAHNVGMFSQKLNGSHTFEHIYEFVSFREGPAINDEVFQVPAGTMCHGRQNTKPLPKMPDNFEMSLEIVVPGSGQQAVHVRTIFDASGLVETWYAAALPLRSGVFSNAFSTVMEDFNSSLIYLVDMKNFTCTVTPMSPHRKKIGMVHGQNLLLLANSGKDTASEAFSYQGQTTFRGMLVDAWATESDGLTFQVYFLPERPLVTYPVLVGMLIKNRTAVPTDILPEIIMENIPPDMDVWHDMWESHPLPADTVPPPPDDQSKVPMTGDQTSWGPRLERILDQKLSEKIIHVFHYYPLLASTLNFHASVCYDKDQICHVRLDVSANYDRDVKNYHDSFSNSLRQTLARKIGVSSLRINSVIPIGKISEDETMVHFSLLGAAPVKGVQQEDISELKRRLEQAIDHGLVFTVQYSTHSRDFIIKRFVYDEQFEMMWTRFVDFFMPNKSMTSNFMDNPTETSASSGYSGGAVAGIAFATLVLGAVLCFGVLFFLYRRRLPNQQSIPYQLTS